MVITGIDGGSGDSVSDAGDLNGDGVPDDQDAFPDDPTETTDSDGVGNTADTDDDNDGSLDTEEAAAGTLPTIPDMPLRLTTGLNMVSLAVAQAGVTTARELAGMIPGLRSLAHIDPLTQRWQRLAMIDGVLQGEDFALATLQGSLAIEMEAPYDAVLWGDANQDGLTLPTGLSFVGLSHVPEAICAFALLEALGGPGRIAVVSRLNPETGRLEAVVYQKATHTGVDFPIRRGEGYLLSLCGAVDNVLAS